MQKLVGVFGVCVFRCLFVSCIGVLADKVPIF